MPDGFLRESVLVTEADDFIALSHPCWTLELPRQWAEQAPGIMDFLRRRSPLGAQDHIEAADLTRLLTAQGCLTVSEEPASYSLREVHALFHGIRNEWCGHYYRHPLWEMLRAGSLPRPRFIAWAVYNYFLSRSAGISASRFVAFSQRTSLRGPLARSMIEEYSHFADYYHIRHSALSIPQREIEEYVQLPSSTAFCQQMLRMAEEDWLGHVLIAYFQESTVQFHQECFEFYSKVEASYGLKDFFKPWRDHIQVDIDCLHAESISELFDSDERVSSDCLHRSLANAWFAFRALLSALDEIADGPAEVNGEWRRRRISIRLNDTTPVPLANQWAATTFIGPLPANLLDLSRLIQSQDRTMNGAVPNESDRDSAFLRSDVARSVYRALSFSNDASLILALGKVAEENGTTFLEETSGERAQHETPETAEAMAIANFLREMSPRPDYLSFALHCLSEPDARARWLPVSEPARHTLSRYLVDQPVNSAVELLTTFAQLLELIARWEGRGDIGFVPNFFTGFGLGTTPRPTTRLSEDADQDVQRDGSLQPSV